MAEPFEAEKKYAVVELVTIAGGRRVLAVSDHEPYEDAIEAAQRLAVEAHNAKQNRHFGVIPITWIRQC